VPSGRSPSVSERRECVSSLKSKYHVSYTTATIAVTCNLRHEKWSDSDVWSLLLYDMCKGFGSLELQTRRFGRLTPPLTLHSSPPPSVKIFYTCLKKAKRNLEDPLKHPRLCRPRTSCPLQCSPDGINGGGGEGDRRAALWNSFVSQSRVVIRLYPIIYFNIILNFAVCQAIALGQWFSIGLPRSFECYFLTYITCFFIQPV